MFIEDFLLSEVEFWEKQGVTSLCEVQALDSFESEAVLAVRTHKEAEKNQKDLDDAPEVS